MSVAQEIKFNHFGVPYIVEFANVSFRPNVKTLKKSNTPSSTFIPTLPATKKTDRYSADAARVSPAQSSLSTRSRSSSRSLTLRRAKRSPSPTESITSWCDVPPYEPPQAQAPVAPIEPDIPKGGRGLYIQFSSFPTSDDPPSYTPRPQPNTSRSYIPRLRRAIANAVTDAGMMESPPAAEKENPMDVQDSSTPPQRKTSKCLFRGTYGQVMSALKDAGLITTPCKEGGIETATRLGVLFVTTSNEDGGVEITKLTLWG
jgi:hypothetical protein